MDVYRWSCTSQSLLAGSYHCSSCGAGLGRFSFGDTFCGLRSLGRSQTVAVVSRGSCRDPRGMQKFFLVVHQLIPVVPILFVRHNNARLQQWHRPPIVSEHLHTHTSGCHLGIRVVKFGFFGWHEEIHCHPSMDQKKKTATATSRRTRSEPVNRRISDALSTWDLS